MASDTSSKDSYHWILYHLKAIEYAQKRLDKKISELPEGYKLAEADAKKLRQIISKLKEIIEEYKNSINFRQQRIIYFIPETEKTKWAEQFRDAENKCYERVFLEEEESIEAGIEEFKPATEYIQQSPHTKRNEDDNAES